MVAHPAIRAAITPARPTAPTPKIAIALPGTGRSTLKTAPAPVFTPQGKAAACSSGTSWGIFTTFPSVASECVAKDDCWKNAPETG